MIHVDYELQGSDHSRKKIYRIRVSGLCIFSFCNVATAGDAFFEFFLCAMIATFLTLKNQKKHFVD